MSFGFNLILILFIIVPGYVALRGYLDATVQLDTFNKTNKIFITVFSGSALIFTSLIIYRIDISGSLCHSVSTITSMYFCIPTSMQLNSELINLDSMPNLSATVVFGVVLLQSALGYTSAYLLGTVVHMRSDTPQSSEKDLQQPWETAIRQSEPYDPLEIITVNGDRVRGKLYRIGSPSEDADVLLFAANRQKENEEIEFLGMSYHHYQDIARVQFPELEPEPPGPEDNYLLRYWNSLLKRRNNVIQSYWEGYYDRCLSERAIETESNRAALLYNYVQNDTEEESA